MAEEGQACLSVHMACDRLGFGVEPLGGAL